MKKAILILSVILTSFAAFSQTKVVKDASGNYVTQKAVKKESDDKPTGATFTTAKGESYPVMISVNGKLYVNRTSKAGNSYKQYLKAE